MEPFPPPGSDEYPTTRGLHAEMRAGQGRFVLRRPLGQGGMGEVWLAIDEKLHEETALKFLPVVLRGDAVALDDLRRETIQTRQLSHPNIVRVHDLFDFEGEDPFISMEFVNGRTLAQERLAYPGRVLPWGYLALYIKQLCEALEYAHGEKVIHRDLKPSNVLVDFDKKRVKLADFGIARILTESVNRVTHKRASGGTIAYMSLQQFKGLPPQPTDDIYSLGATLYELLTSKPPFHSGDTTWQIEHGDLVSLQKRLTEFKIDNDVPKHIEDTVLTCLSRDPKNRPQTAREVAESLGLLESKGRGGRRAARQARAATPPPSAGAPTAPTVAIPGRTPSATPDLAPIEAAISEALPESQTGGGTGALTSVPAGPITTQPLPHPATHTLTVVAVVISLLALVTTAGVMVYNALEKKNRTQPPPAETAKVPADVPPDQPTEPSYAAVARPSEPATTPHAGTATPAAAPPQPTSASNLSAIPNPAIIPPAVPMLIPPPDAPKVVTTEPLKPKPLPDEPRVTPASPPSSPATPTPPRAGQPWTNSLGMRFVPLKSREYPHILFSVGETRVQDFHAFLSRGVTNETIYNLLLHEYTNQPSFKRSTDAIPDEATLVQNMIRLHTTPSFTQALDHPVVLVSWNEAQIFCKWLSEEEQSQGLLSKGQSYRLPGDLEWSAAVGLTNEPRNSTPKSRVNTAQPHYPWGKDFGDSGKANLGSIGGHKDRFVYTAPVKSFPPCPYQEPQEIFDLAGNVWEWCEDEYSPGDKGRVLRGGSWRTDTLDKAHSAYRERYASTFVSDDLGFRCVLVLKE